MSTLDELTDSKVLSDLGGRLARYRLDRNLTQSQLAREAGVSKTTVFRLENGGSTQLTNFVRILRALGILTTLDALVPGPLTSPLAELKSRSKERRRASPIAKKSKAAATWTWGDENEHGEEK